ncbi:MAG: RNA polymerase sigma factor [Planctomycetota bacterium]
MPDAADTATRRAQEAAARAAAPDDSRPLEELEDHELMLLVKAESLPAFETLFRRFERPIYSYFARLSSDRVGAEDYTQDVFTRLWSSRHLYEPTGKFTNYLYQIARNYWINELKRRSIRPRGANLETVLPFAESEHRDDQPLTNLVRRELGELIDKALSEIPDEQREVFILSRHHKLRYQEIAEIMDIPVRTVESRLVLATRKLMSKLAAWRRTL